ncbi:uncharacterized protein LOC111312031 isoform X2 [Durio zibethinus]|nr:uncharacterized protein LOC111312031 isoform X2 [Durio zibethinus]
MTWMNLFSANSYSLNLWNSLYLRHWLIHCDRNPWNEAFAVCENYLPPEGFNPKDLHHLLEMVGSPSGGDDLDCGSEWLEGPTKVYIPFLACGDLSGYDSDRSYPLPKIADGTFQRALEMKKASSHGIRDLKKHSLDS